MIAKANQGDTARSWTDTLEIGDVPVNLTGATVVLRMTRKHPPLTDDDDEYVDLAATVVSALAGTVSVEASAEVVAVAGNFWLRWIVTYTSTGKQLTVPTGDPIQLTIYPAP